MRFALWLLRQLCSRIGHRGPALSYAIDETGTFMFFDCGRCRTVIIETIDHDQPMENYKAALIEWLDEAT